MAKKSSGFNPIVQQNMKRVKSEQANKKKSTSKKQDILKDPAHQAFLHRLQEQSCLEERKLEEFEEYAREKNMQDRVPELYSDIIYTKKYLKMNLKKGE
jgi:hypothetical protein